MPDIATTTMPFPTIHHAQIRHGALRPPCLRRGSQTETMLGKVFLECVASFVDPSQAKWVFEGRKLIDDNDYQISCEKQGEKQHKFVCEIKMLEKSLAGTYKLVLKSADGLENEALFSLPLLGLERCDWKNYAGLLTMDPIEVREVPPSA